jgi:succinoglycan biosynthesis transport protein ExoP
MSIYKDLLTQRCPEERSDGSPLEGKGGTGQAQNLHHMLDQHLNASNWVLFTATHSGAGTTYILCDLAQYFSQYLIHGDQRLLLIDGNSQSPDLHSRLGAENALGLSDLLLTGKVDQILQRDVLPHVDFISNGAGRLFFPENLFKGQDSVLLQFLSQYRYVLVDSPPVFSHPDTLVLARMFNSVVLVTEYRKTKKDVVEEAKRRLEGTGARVIGGVINKLRHNIPQWLYNRI